MPTTYDAMSQDRVGERNDCSVVATALVTERDYAEVHRVFRLNGRKSRRRTEMSITFKSLKALGFEAEQVYYPTRARGYIQNPGYANRFRSKTVTKIEGEIQRKDPKGHYLIRTRGHILAFANGRIQDWTAGRRHRVIEVYHVQPISIRGEVTMATKKTAKTTATKTAKKAPKKSVKTTKKATAKATTKKTTKAAPTKVETNGKKTDGMQFTLAERRRKCIELLQKRKLFAPLSSISIEDLAGKLKFTKPVVYGLGLLKLGYVELADIEGQKGNCIYLSKKGKSADLKAKPFA